MANIESSKWNTASKQDMEAYCGLGKFAWCHDGQFGFFRPLRPGETLAQAREDFELAGEECVDARIYENGEWTE